MKRIIAGIVLTLVPVLGVNWLKQTAWGSFAATPRARMQGADNAKVLLVEYSDFQCPMCAQMAPVLHEFVERYKGQVRLAYKYYPLTRMHKNAMSSAVAAECAADQNQFWPYSDELFKSQRQWADLPDATTTYVGIARQLHLNDAQFSACLTDPAKAATIQQDVEEGNARQISATPTLFIGDERLVGNVITSDGTRVIERELRQ